MYIGVANAYYADSVLCFVVIPCVHLMNNEDTKAVVFGESWYHGIRHMLGIYTKPVQAIAVDISNQPRKKKINQLNSNNPGPEPQNNVHLFRKKIYPRRCSSAHSLFPLTQLLDGNDVEKLNRYNSLREVSSVHIQHKESKLI